MIAALVRGLVLLSLASAIGGLVLGLLFPASAAPDLDVARARLRRWVATCLVILLVATWAELLVRTQAMSGASLGASVAAVTTRSSSCFTRRNAAWLNESTTERSRQAWRRSRFTTASSSPGPT